MLGKMNTEPLLCLKDAMSLDAEVGELLKLTENTGIARWVQFPRAVLLFLVVPNDPASGAFYVSTVGPTRGSGWISRTKRMGATSWPILTL